MTYRPEIDGLRALAVVPVIFFHASFQTFSGGFVGVDVFFVISGYLITSIILAETQAGTFRLANFYERRARRILPALCVVAMACLPLAWLLLLPEDMKGFAQSLAAVFTFSSNFHFWQTSGYFEAAAEQKPLLHTWSLAVEEQYYLLFPIFMLLSWRFGKRWIVGALAIAAIFSLSVAQWGSINYREAAFFLLPTRGWELLLGALLSFWSGSARRQSGSQLASMAGLVLIAYAVFAFDKYVPFPGLPALVPTVGTALVIHYANAQTLVGRLLGSRLLVGVGLVSYSAYLWHQPLFVFARYGSVVEPGSRFSAVLIVATFALAYLTWKYVEIPFRTRRWLRSDQLACFASASCCLFVTFGLIGHFNGGFPQRFSDALLKTIGTTPIPEARRRGCASDVGRYVEISDKCILGDDAAVTGALLGDSLAFSLSFELHKALKAKRLGLINMSFVSCPPILDLYRVDLGGNHKCPEGNKEALDYVKDNRRLGTVILFAHWTAWLEGTDFDNGEGGVWTNDSWVDVIVDGERMKTRDRNVRKAQVAKKYLQGILRYIEEGKKVILIYPIPEVGWNAPVYAGERAAMKERFPGMIAREAEFSTSYRVYQLRNRKTIETLDRLGEHPNLIRIHPDKLLCNTFVSGRCVFRANGVNLYIDGFHLSDAGARLLVGEIMKYVTY